MKVGMFTVLVSPLVMWDTKMERELQAAVVNAQVLTIAPIAMRAFIRILVLDFAKVINFDKIIS